MAQQRGSNPTQVIAAGRVAVALLALLFAVTDPDLPGFQIEFDDLTVLTYLIFSLGSGLLVWNSWWRDHRLIPWILVIDVFGFILIPLELEPQIAAYLVVAPIIGILIIVEVGYYFSRRATLLAVAGLNLVCIAICLWHIAGGMGFDAAELLRRTLLFLGISLLAAWLSEGIIRPNVLPMDVSTDQMRDRAAMGAAAVSYAMRAGGAAGAALSLNDPVTKKVVVLRDGVLAEDGLHGVPDCAISSHRVLLFDSNRRHGLSLGDKGRITPTKLSNREIAALARIGARQGGLVTVPGTTSDCCLILTGVSSLNRHDLYRLEEIGRKLSVARDRFDLLLRMQEIATARLREEVARDLHDGVAQSLAGAHYWLSAIVRNGDLSDENKATIGQMITAFDGELLHVREMIGTLRHEYSTFDRRDLKIAISEMTQRLAQQWQAEIALTLPEGPMMVSKQLAFDLKQVLREAIANAVKHGSARKIEIAFHERAGVMSFEIADDGTGFDTTMAVAHPQSIAERVAHLGGDLDVVKQSHGATIRFTVPKES